MVGFFILYYFNSFEMCPCIELLYDLFSSPAVLFKLLVCLTLVKTQFIVLWKKNENCTVSRYLEHRCTIQQNQLTFKKRRIILSVKCLVWLHGGSCKDVELFVLPRRDSKCDNWVMSRNFKGELLLLSSKGVYLTLRLVKLNLVLFL